MIKDNNIDCYFVFVSPQNNYEVIKTIIPTKKPLFTEKPFGLTFEESKNYYLWGLVGEHRFDVNEIFGDKKVLQIQSQATFKNVLFGILTFGIYSPHTWKIWCGEDVSND